MISRLLKKLSMPARVQKVRDGMTELRPPYRMFKKVSQQGRSEEVAEAYPWVRRGYERSENKAGGLFQHPVREENTAPAAGAPPTPAVRIPARS